MPTPKEYQELLAGGCPWCGETLVIRKGKNGEFIACAEWCGYTKSIPRRSEYPPRTAIKRPCHYNKCDGSGLIPFQNEEGEIIPYTFSHCGCHSQYGIVTREYYSAIQPEDYDFPMSSNFRVWTFENCGVPDPGYVLPKPEPIEPQPQEVIHRHSNISSKDFALLRNLEGQLKYLQHKLTEREKPKVQGKFGYRNIK